MAKARQAMEEARLKKTEIWEDEEESSGQLPQFIRFAAGCLL